MKVKAGAYLVGFHTGTGAGSVEVIVKKRVDYETFKEHIKQRITQETGKDYVVTTVSLMAKKGWW